MVPPTIALEIGVAASWSLNTTSKEMSTIEPIGAVMAKHGCDVEQSSLNQDPDKE